MGIPLYSPTSFWPISLTCCVSQLFERILSCLLFFLELNFIFSPRQASFHPGLSTPNQILYLSQSILDGFNKPNPGFQAILAIIDFPKALDYVWHPALFHKLILAGLSPCFACWTYLSFLIGTPACFFQIAKVAPFESVKGFSRICSWPSTFFSFINDLLVSLFSFISCSLYADNLVFLLVGPCCSGGYKRSSDLTRDLI